MVSMRDIKQRKASIQSTQQITKAMKLAYTAKFQKAKQQVERSGLYSKQMNETVEAILSITKTDHPLMEKRTQGKRAFILISSNRGLAGGYNINAAKLLMNAVDPSEESIIYTVGKKGKKLLTRRGYHVTYDYSSLIDAPTYKEAVTIGQAILNSFNNNEIKEVNLIYTSFKSMISQEPKLIQLLPVPVIETSKEKGAALMNFEGSEEETLDRIIPIYLNSMLYMALTESIASEHGSRVTAMDAAYTNSVKMIEELSLQYNRARQAAITQELSEIVGGSEALGS